MTPIEKDSKHTCIYLSSHCKSSEVYIKHEHCFTFVTPRLQLNLENKKALKGI